MSGFNPKIALPGIAFDGGVITISWEGAGALEFTSELGGGWTPVSDATSPYSMPTDGNLFFRLSE